MKIFYVYIDYRTDDNRPFYVGKGTGRRFSDVKRNKIHASIANRHGMVRKMILETLDESYAFDEEVRLIRELQTHVKFKQGGANLTDGGEGNSGSCTETNRSAQLRPEVVAKKSATLKGIWETEERRTKQAAGMSRAWHDSDYRQLQIDVQKAVWSDPERLEKHRNQQRLIWSDPSLREKLSAKLKGRKVSDETRAKMSEAAKKRRKATTSVVSLPSDQFEVRAQPIQPDTDETCQIPREQEELPLKEE